MGVSLWECPIVRSLVKNRSFARVKNRSFVLLACVKLLTEGRNFWNFCWNQIKNVFCVKILYEKVPFAFFVLILSNSGRLQWKVPNDQPRPPIKRLKPPDRPKCTRGPNRRTEPSDWPTSRLRQTTWSRSTSLPRKGWSFRSTLRLSEASLQEVEASVDV